jgi:hypothetical protein
MKLFKYVAAASLLAAFTAGLRYWTGRDYRVDILLVLVGAFVLLTITLPLYERSVREQISRLDPRDVASLEEADDSFREFMADRLRQNERRDWHWQATDIVGLIAFTVYPPMVYTVWRYRELEGSTPFDGWAVISMIAGLLSYLYWRRRRVAAYRCPACNTVPVRLAGVRLRFACRLCGVTWLLGDSSSTDVDRAQAT